MIGIKGRCVSFNEKDDSLLDIIGRYEGCCYEASNMPEKALLSALLENAIRDAIKAPIRFKNCPNKLALEWLHISEPLLARDLAEPPIFSFVWVAQMLSLEPEALSRKIASSLHLLKAKNFERKRIR